MRKSRFKYMLLLMLLFGALGADYEHAQATHRAQVDPVEDLITQALLKFDDKAYREALLLLDQAVDEYPYDSQLDMVQALIGDAHYFLEQYDQAIAAYQIVLDHYPESEWRDEAQYSIGVCYQAIGELTEAQQILQTFIETYPDSPWIVEAREKLQSIMTSASETIPTEEVCALLKQEGLEAANQGHYEASVVKYQAALRCYQHHDAQEEIAKIYNNLGVSYQALESYDQAEQYLLDAIRLAETQDLPEVLARAQFNLGQIYNDRERYVDALEVLQPSLAYWEATDHQYGQAATESYLAAAYIGLGGYQKALDLYQQSLAYWTMSEDTMMQALTLNAMGMIYVLHFYDNLQAIAHFEQAVPLFVALNEDSAAAMTLILMGNAESNMGNLLNAVRDYERALSLARQAQDHEQEARSLNLLGEMYGDRLKDYAYALTYQKQALAAWQSLSDSPDVLNNQAETLERIGFLYAWLEDYEQAVYYYEQVIALLQETGDTIAQADILMDIGDLARGIRVYETAVDAYTLALEHYKSAGNTGGVADAYLKLAMIYHFMGDDELAVEYLGAVEELREDLVFDYQPFEANFIERIALMYEALSDYAQALDYQEDALAIYRAMEDYAGQAATWEAIGALYETQGEIAPALDAYRRAIEFNETLHSSAKIEEFKITMAEQSADVYARAICLAMRLGQPGLAFHLAERGRARTFLDQIGNVRVDPGATDDPDLIAREQALLAEIRGLEAVLSGRSSFETLNFDSTRGGAPPLSSEQYNEVRSRLDEAYRDYEHLLAQIKLSNPEYADLRAVDASTLITVQQTLPANTTLVEYYVVSPTQTLAFVVTSDTLHTIPLSLTYQSVITELEAFDAETRASLAGVPDSMQRLYDWLCAPVRAHIHTQAVLIAPHQQLHYLPFEALHDGARYLVEEYIIGYLPSASLLRYLDGSANERAGQSALVLGNPDHPEVSSLSGAEAEARAVAELFGVPAHLNAAATESLLWEQATGARYVHVAAHGAFNATAPQFSRLYLAPSDAGEVEAAGDARSSHTDGGPSTHTDGGPSTHPEGGPSTHTDGGPSTHTDGGPSTHTDGLLETREVWNLRLEDADLVALSACQTQLGDMSAGDELVGLSRAFIYAGTPSLVASLWSVEDASTAYLMTRFYGYLQEGMGKGAALRQAKLDTMAQEEWQSPFFWSAFILSGDMGALGRIPPERQVQPTSTAMPVPVDGKKKGGLGGVCPSMALPLALFAAGLWWRERWR